MKNSRSLLAFVIVMGASIASFAQNPAITIQVDANANRRPIDPRVYGLSWADTASLNDLNVPLNRQGGNATTRYNWQVNADNRAADWYFESIGYASATPGAEGDSFIASTKSAGAEAMLTIPTIGWVARVGNNRSKLASFSIAKYGAQTGNDWQWFPDAGNGIRTNGQYVTGNDRTDANVQVDSLFQKGWVQHLVGTWGPASSGGLRYYILDNEPSIWFSTHRDVQPDGKTMDDIRGRMIDYGSMIRSVDPSAVIVGPEEWGWSGYTLSGYDQQWGSLNGWSNLPDRAAHGGADYLPWILDQLRQYEQSSGVRVLDVFTVHYYPQGGEFGDDVSSSMQLRRNRSTRSLWDPNYTDETWINDKVRLIPRIKGWVASNYPGLQTGITEYNWGAESHINGATTQADILGIFGREGLDLAARWTTPAASTPTYKAIRMYRNYDGSKSTFGDTSVGASVPNPDQVSAFAAERSSDGALTVMVIAKVLSGSTPATISLAGFPHGGAAQVWQLTSQNSINHLSDVPVSGGAISTSLPAQSITLFVIPRSGGNAPPTAVASATPTSGTAPLVVNFSGAASSDSDGTIVSYAWAFGDGGTASGVSAAHTYSAAGTYAATLTVTDDDGATATSTLTINVTALSVAAPSNLSAKVSGSTVTLTWQDKSNNEAGFYIERTAKGSSSWTRVGQTAANVKTWAQSAAKGTWVYRVQAFHSSGIVSGYSNQVQARVR